MCIALKNKNKKFNLIGLCEECHDKLHNGELEIGFFDKGRPVDQGNVRHRKIDDIKPGGLGTFFIQQIMDAVVFKEGEKPWINHLILTKKINY